MQSAQFGSDFVPERRKGRSYFPHEIQAIAGQ
jgi:phytoene/squalene synthetase